MKKPNLLFIFTDQQRPDTMRCYGNEMIQTPYLNALAESSFVFDHASVSQPVCSTSRADGNTRFIHEDLFAKLAQFIRRGSR